MSFIDIAYAGVIAPVAQTTTGEAPKDEGVAASLGLNGQLFVFQLINFAIVAAILWFLILKPLTKKMEERKKIIDVSLDKAQEIERNLQESQKKFNEKLDEAKLEGNKIIEKAASEATEMSAEMKTKARKEIETLVEQAKVKIQNEKEQVMEGLKKETVGLVVLALEKILSEKIDSPKDKQVIEEMLKTLKK